MFNNQQHIPDDQLDHLRYLFSQLHVSEANPDLVREPVIQMYKLSMQITTS